MLSSLPAEPNLICLEIVIRNGIPLTFITSADKVTFLYCDMILSGTVCDCVHSASGVVRTVLPLRLPRSGPQMNSALCMSWVVMGQFGMRLFSM